VPDPLWSFRFEFEARRARREFEQGGETAIHAALQHKSEYWRWAAASALSNVGDERAVEALKQLLDDSSEFVRSHARFQLDWLERKRREDRKNTNE
jgi:HEAT repeat protein